MKGLIINPGSTSYKYTLFDEERKIGEYHFNKTNQKYAFDDTEITKNDFENSFAFMLHELKKRRKIRDFNEIDRFGIRIVHGGDLFYKPTKINTTNLQRLKTLSSLAPLHNPPAVKVIEQIFEYQTNASVHGVFDTAFHQTIPDFVSTYAIPQQLSEKYHIKKYGFHGIACQSVMAQLKKLVRTKNIQPLTNNSLQKLIICHLGGGASLTAVKNGESQATSMGFTPLEGLMMITRAGDLDDGVIFYLAEKLGKTNEEVSEILNQESGIFGITGLKDMRQVIKRAKNGEPRSKLAFDMFCYRILKYIFAYYGHLQGLDALVFSGGIGEGSVYLRKKIMEKLKMLGFALDANKNQNTTYETGLITQNDSKPAFVVHVEEDREIWRQMREI